MGLGTALVVVAGIFCGTGLLITMFALLFGAKSEGLLAGRRIPKGTEKRLSDIEESLRSQQSDIRQLEEENRFLRGLLEDRSSHEGE